MDGKKKKNRKKKGNQSKSMDDATTNAEAAVVPEPDHGSAPEQNHNVQIPGNSDVQSIGVSESDIEVEKHDPYEANIVNLKEEVRHLEEDKSLWLQKEACLEEKIRLLQNEVESCVQKEANLEEKLRNIQIGNEALIHKQVILEDRIKHIEGIKDSWNLKEASIKEMMAQSDEANEGLQMQVKQLQESRNCLVKENQQLTESMSALELQMQYLERKASFYGSSTLKITEDLSEEKNHLHQIEAAHPTVDMLITENAEIEMVAHEVPNDKVNELHIEPDQHIVAVEPSTTELDHVVAPTGAANPSDYTSEYGDKIQSVVIHETFHICNGSDEAAANAKVRQEHLPELDESRISEDVVSVSLDDIQAQEPDPQAVKSGEGLSSAVPLSDAPLIGAPFRLISFMTRYVSGADLVNSNRSKSSQ